jgi:hypothetical protein
MPNLDEAPRAEEQEDRLPWHKPQVQRIVIALHTGENSGSGEDGGIYEVPADGFG